MFLLLSKLHTQVKQGRAHSSRDQYLPSQTGREEGSYSLSQSSITTLPGYLQKLVFLFLFLEVVASPRGWGLVFYL